jgi:hypothetical protein
MQALHISKLLYLHAVKTLYEHSKKNQTAVKVLLSLYYPDMVNLTLAELADIENEEIQQEAIKAITGFILYKISPEDCFPNGREALSELCMSWQGQINANANFIFI